MDHIKNYDRLTLEQLYPKLRSRIISETRKLLVIKNNIKLTMGCNVSWKIITKDTNESKFINQTVKTTTIEAYSKDEVDNVVDKLFDKLDKLFNTMKHKESGYALSKIHHLFIEFFLLNPLEVLHIFLHLKNLVMQKAV